MGSPKALLVLEGETFLARLVRELRAGGCEEVVVVTGPTTETDSAGIADEATVAGARLAVNPDRDSPQVESLRAALRALPAGTAAVVVTPVDAPRASRKTVAMLLEAWRSGASVAIPTFEGRRGHPVLFGGPLFEELLGDELPEGARTVIQRHSERLALVPVGDPGILLDVDTPADYARLRETAP
jgi:molybdenum cofactor cytidylyltransferase